MGTITSDVVRRFSISTAELGDSSAGLCAQGECRFNIYHPGLEGSSAGSRAQGRRSRTVLYGRITQGAH